MNNNTASNGDDQKKISPDNPKIRIIRLIVGMVIIVMGIIIFNLASKLKAEADARDAAEKAAHPEPEVPAYVDSLRRV